MEQPATPSSETVEVPKSALVACPLVGFKLRAVSACSGCPKFAGLEDRFPKMPIDFSKRYLVRCFGEPVKRNIQTMEG